MGEFLTRLYATHTGILTSSRSTCLHSQASQLLERSPTTRSYDQVHSFGVTLEPRDIFGAGTLDQ